MNYRPIIKNNFRLFHIAGKCCESILSMVIGSKQAKIFKQKIKILMKAKPEQSVMSDTENRIFNMLKNRFHVIFEVGIQNDLSFYEAKPDSEFHLFEPNKKFAKNIKKRIAGFKGHRIKFNEFGLSDAPAKDCVYFEESESFIVNPTFIHGDVDTGMRYSLSTLDTYVTDAHIQHIDMLKIDTEGFDYKVLLGARHTLSAGKIDCIQFEYWNGSRKFHDLLSSTYDLYLMMEPRLLSFIAETIEPLMTHDERSIDTRASLIPLDENLMNLIDLKIVPRGAGGNIFAIRKGSGIDAKKLLSRVSPYENPRG